MRKKTIIFSALILWCVTVFAQNKMDKTTFEHLVDYANCTYLMAFIEGNDKGKPYIKDTYEKNIKPVLQTATLDNLNTVPDYNKIKALFTDLTNKDALQFADKINERKGKYNEVSDDKSLIKSLQTTGWKNIDLSEVGTKIIDAINEKFNAVQTANITPSSDQKIVDSQPIQTSSSAVALPTKVNLQEQFDILQEKVSAFRLLVIFCFVTIVLLIATWTWWYKSQFNTANRNSSVRKFVKNVFFTSEEINNKFENIYIKTGTDTFEANKKLTEFKDQLNEMKRQFFELNSTINSKKVTGTPNATNQAPNQLTPGYSNSSAPKELEMYFASKSNKEFTEQLPNSANASFKVYSVKGNEAKFEYIGAVRNENWFEGVCSIENSANDNLSDKNYIETTHPGKVRKENDNWVVSSPAKIKFS